MSLDVEGIAKAGGLKGLSEQYKVNFSTLYNYLNKDGTLTVKGKVFLGGKSNKLTPEILKAMMSLSSEGIIKAGGLKRLSEQYKVNLTTLYNYLNKDGTLTVKGKVFLGGKSNKITPELLKSIISLGKEGITKAGGLGEISKQYNVNFNTLRSYIQTNGTLTEKNNIFVGGKTNKITPELLKSIISLGKEGIAKAGGLRGISEQYKINFNTLNSYLNKSGTLTVRGKAFLGGKFNKITPELLKSIVLLGAEGIEKAGGLVGLSEQYKVNWNTLHSYLYKNGSLTVRGKRFLGIEFNKITHELLTEMVSLGAKGIAKSGGLKGLSEKYNINVDLLKRYMFENSTLTSRGERFIGNLTLSVKVALLFLV